MTVPMMYHILFFSSSPLSVCPDITRACLIDESQGRNFAEVLPVILKEIGRQKSEELYPVSLTMSPCFVEIDKEMKFFFQKLGPLAPTRNMVKNYFESFEWKGKTHTKFMLPILFLYASSLVVWLP